MSSSFTQFNTNLNSTSGMVNIYVRNYKKHAVVLPVKSQMTGQELHEKIKNKYLSKVSDFVLYFKGKVVPAN